MSSRSNSESDIEMKTAPLKKGKKQKIPNSPTTDLLKEPKKLTTKEMINDALEELKSRKGVSYQAIKRYLVEKYQVDTDKMNFYIKKYLKTAVESGAVIQTKGTGATGSFRLAAVKKKNVEKSEKNPKKTEISKKTAKVEKIAVKEKKNKVKVDIKEIKKKSNTKDKTDGLKSKKVQINKEATEKTKKQETKMVKKTKNDSKTVKSKSTKATQTPAKNKKAMMKRKSIGSIIKPPKMKPKAN